PMELDAQGRPTGRILVSDADLQSQGQPLTTVALPEAGTGNQIPSSAGASLLVVYRTPDDPLRSIDLYDGIAIQAPDTTTTHIIRGFLQAADNATGKLTHIGGSGAKNPTDRIFFN